MRTPLASRPPANFTRIVFSRYLLRSKIDSFRRFSLFSPWFPLPPACNNKWTNMKNRSLYVPLLLKALTLAFVYNSPLVFHSFWFFSFFSFLTEAQQSKSTLMMLNTYHSYFNWIYLLMQTENTPIELRKEMRVLHRIIVYCLLGLCSRLEWSVIMTSNRD